MYEIHFTWSRDGSFIHLSSISSFSKFQNDVNITDANFYANITEKKLAEILKSDSDTPIPLLEERVAVLREAGKVLLEVNEKSQLMYTSKMFKHNSKAGFEIHWKIKNCVIDVNAKIISGKSRNFFLGGGVIVVIFILFCFL